MFEHFNEFAVEANLQHLASFWRLDNCKAFRFNFSYLLFPFCSYVAHKHDTPYSSKLKRKDNHNVEPRIFPERSFMRLFETGTSTESQLLKQRDKEHIESLLKLIPESKRSLLKTMTNKEFAEALDISQADAARIRKHLRISRSVSVRSRFLIEWSKEMLAEIGKISDRKFSDKYKVSEGSVARKRKELGIEGCPVRVNCKMCGANYILPSKTCAYKEVKWCKDCNKYRRESDRRDLSRKNKLNEYMNKIAEAVNQYKTKDS